jgi:hypothetical protein
MHRPAGLGLIVSALVQIVAAPVLADERFSDPFAYCAAVGTIDARDDRYIGPKMPDAVVRGLKEAMGVPADAPDAPFFRTSFWRCMNGKVYACTIGANLPCQEKADTSRAPSEAVSRFCRQNPGADVVPMVVTGRATVFEWRCDGPKPAIVRQLAHPDAQGYLAGIWYEIEQTGAR